MSIAMLSAHRSKDPSKQVGACIVGKNRVIMGIGYNGFPRGCSDSSLPWAKKSKHGIMETKHPYVVRIAVFCKYGGTCALKGLGGRAGF